MTEYMRMSGMYWVMTALDLAGSRDRLPAEEVISAVSNCQEESGGFVASPGHDAHILYTLSAVQVKPKSIISVNIFMSNECTKVFVLFTRF